MNQLGEAISGVFSGPSNGQDTISRGLEAIRTHLGMEVAYVSEFVGDKSVFRHVDAPGLEAAISVGDEKPLDDVFCRHILAGRLPELMPDVSREPLAMSLPIMREVPIGAHVSVPIRLPDGEPYGMFCCLSFQANPTLNSRDLQMMKVFADMAAHQIARDVEGNRVLKDKRDRIRQVIEAGAFSIVIEGVLESIAIEITNKVDCPTIGIGASAGCDGQILVTDDMLGLFDWTPKFVRRYADLKTQIERAAAQYASDVRDRSFPGPAETYYAKKP